MAKVSKDYEMTLALAAAEVEHQRLLAVIAEMDACAAERPVNDWPVVGPECEDRSIVGLPIALLD